MAPSFLFAYFDFLICTNLSNIYHLYAEIYIFFDNHLQKHEQYDILCKNNILFSEMGVSVMKKVVALLMALCIVAVCSFTGCGSVKLDKRYALDGRLSFSMPSKWAHDRSGDLERFFAKKIGAPDDGYMTASYVLDRTMKESPTSDEAQTFLETYYKAYSDTDAMSDVKELEPLSQLTSGLFGAEFLATMTIDGTDYPAVIELFYKEQTVYSFIFCMPKYSSTQLRDFGEDFRNTLQFKSNTGFEEQDRVAGYRQADKNVYSGKGFTNNYIFFDGKIEDVQQQNGVVVALASDSNRKSWELTVGDIPQYAPDNVAVLKDKEVRIFGKFTGSSEDGHLTMQVQQIGDKQSEKIYEDSAFRSSGDQFIALVEQSGAPISWAAATDGSHAGQYVYMDGYITDLSKSSADKKVTFLFSQNIDGNFAQQTVELPYSSNPAASSLKAGGVRLYGTVGSDNVFCAEKAKEMDVGFGEAEIISLFKASCGSLSYDEAARNPTAHVGEKVQFTGKVVQVIDGASADYVTMRVNVTLGSYSIYRDTVYVTYTLPAGSQRILEDDIITMYGMMDGTKTYTSTLGASITIPQLHAKYIDIIG